MLTADEDDQTLSGDGAGKLTMVETTNTTFQDTAALFNGDDIKGFGAGDFIDVTGLAFVSAGTGSGQTSLGLSGGELSVLVGGVTKSTVTLAGTFNPNGFTLASDGNTGTLIGYHT